MIFLLSPAKTFRKNPLHVPTNKKTMFSDKTRELQALLTQKTLDEYKDLLHCSQAVAQKTREYYINPTHKDAALSLFHGEAFRHFHAETLDETAWTYAQYHLYILSAYYGVLRSLDPITFHRLDPHDKLMKTSLVEFWQKEVKEFFRDKEIISLASMEYAQMLQGLVYYQVEFYQNEKLVHSMLAKKLRGLTARVCVDLQIDTLSQFCQLQIEGFTCSEVTPGKIKFNRNN